MGLDRVVEPPAAAEPASQSRADDADLVQRLRAGDAEAFGEVVRTWSPAMLRVARSHVSTDASAQEVVQETWLAVIRGLPAFEGRSLLRTWTFAILVNLARRRGVRDRRQVPLSSLELGEAEPLVDPDRFRGPTDPWAGGWKEGAWPQDWGPEAHLLGGEVRDLLATAISTLPERQRDVLVLRDLHDLSTQEVAQSLDLSVGNVRVLLHRARVRLRNLLEDYYRADGTGPTPGLGVTG
jgi:RNA polymerase sigma-70 factor, ECF subfamily